MFEVSILFKNSSHECLLRAPGTPISSVPCDISRSIGSDEREKNPINDLCYVLRRQRLLQYHELIAHEVERQCSQARRQFLGSDFAASNPAGENFRHYFGVAFMHFCKER